MLACFSVNHNLHLANAQDARGKWKTRKAGTGMESRKRLSSVDLRHNNHSKSKMWNPLLASSPGSLIFSTLHAQERWGSLVKLITCVLSGGTNFHIWYNCELSKIKSRDAESSSSSISTLQSAMNQQVEMLTPFATSSKLRFTWQLDCVHAQVEPTDVDTIKLPCKSLFWIRNEGTEGPLLAYE